MIIKYCVIKKFRRIFNKRPLKSFSGVKNTNPLLINSAINEFAKNKQFQRERVVELERMIFESSLSESEKMVFRERLRNAILRARKQK